MMERIPVGTFMLERNPSGSAAFTFVSSGLLAMINADRDSVIADPDARASRDALARDSKILTDVD